LECGVDLAPWMGGLLGEKVGSVVQFCWDRENDDRTARSFEFVNVVVAPRFCFLGK
jgi:hypothetical protein